MILHSDIATLLILYHVARQPSSVPLPYFPAGCLPLCLAILTSVLKNVKYPLLRHSTVYAPLCQLVSVATRYDTLYCQLGKTSSIAQDEQLSYKRRLGELWARFSSQSRLTKCNKNLILIPSTTSPPPTPQLPTKLF